MTTGTINKIGPEDIARFIAANTRLSTAVANTQYGRYFFNTKDEIVGWTIAVEGVWEKAETDFMLEIVREGDTVIDAGANLGWFTIILAKKVGTAGRIVAFEPEPSNYQLLLDNLKLNSVEAQTKAFRSAIWDTNDGIRLELSQDNLGDHRPKTTDANSVDASRPSLTLPSCRLDDALTYNIGFARDEKIRLIKMDCQGAETRIFRGADATLARTEYLICEYEPKLLHGCGTTTSEFVERMQKHFDEFRRLDSIAEIWPDYSPIAELTSDVERPLNRRGYTNYVFRKRQDRPCQI